MKHKSQNDAFRVIYQEGLAMDIGCIGRGSMGAAIVPNLVEAGHRVSVWNRTWAATRAFEGVTVLTSPAAACSKDAVVSILG
jgi:3-hydroxyisobutyrate dehydrogenase-like beta-hydroxyacid dehydrogenase